MSKYLTKITSTVASSSHFSTQQSRSVSTRFLRASSAHSFTSFACMNSKFDSLKGLSIDYVMADRGGGVSPKDYNIT